ncbi:hypothetical protein [Hyphomicrobium sp.]|jgi:hypothetical protein|uniref:hypothetical protein n=1 Tax=Hyphomicrobium sp. TaxID=82 RepID=UPI002FE1B056
MTSPADTRCRRTLGQVLALAALLAVPLLAFAPTPADAAGIKCIDGFQIVSGSRIATPYCQDKLVAQVAREHGMKVSEAEIRNNPNYKRHICQFVGRDIRIYQACIDANSLGRRPF